MGGVGKLFVGKEGSDGVTVGVDVGYVGVEGLGSVG